MGACKAFSQIQPVAFAGAQATDGWVIDFVSYPQSTYGGYPGTKTWSQPMVANQAGSQGGTLTKVSNGLGGGPYPGDHLYFGGFSTNPNTFGGTIQLSVTPLASVKKIVLQVQITEAYGLDFYQPNGAPTLWINANAVNIPPAVSLTQHDWIDQVGYTGALEDLYLNTYRYEWDIGSLSGTVGSIAILMSVVQHGEIYALQVDQGLEMATTPVTPPSIKILSVGSVSYQNGESTLEVSFQGEPGKSYVLECNESLSPAGWFSDSQSVSTGTGTFTKTFRALGDRRTAWQRQLFFRARWP